MSEIRPMYNKVIVKRDEAENKSKGGIYIPDVGKEPPTRGVVVAAGPGIRRDDGSYAEIHVKAGDKILFSKYGGVEVKFDEVEHLIINSDDILAVIDD